MAPDVIGDLIGGIHGQSTGVMGGGASPGFRQSDTAVQTTVPGIASHAFGRPGASGATGIGPAGLTRDERLDPEGLDGYGFKVLVRAAEDLQAVAGQQFLKRVAQVFRGLERGQGELLVTA